MCDHCSFHDFKVQTYGELAPSKTKDCCTTREGLHHVLRETNIWQKHVRPMRDTLMWPQGGRRHSGWGGQAPYGRIAAETIANRFWNVSELNAK